MILVMVFTQRGAKICVFHTRLGSSNISLDLAKPTTRLFHISYLHYHPQGQAIQAMWRQTVFVGTSTSALRFLFGAGGSIATTLICVPHWGDEKQSFSFAKKEKGGDHINFNFKLVKLQFHQF
jgi:hypothetical protein